MEIRLNYHKVNQFLQLKITFEEIARWTINKLNLLMKTLDIIFTSDSYLQQLHKDFFDLDTKTDVITFHLNDSPDEIEGEIYISLERAVDNSKQYKVSSEIEICRLIIHGCLHLAGYNDQNESDLFKMKEEENKLVKEVGLIFKNKLYVGVN
jgi:rRNA maturation RNase YbeY